MSEAEVSIPQTQVKRKEQIPVNQKSEDIITKEETMFKIDANGKAMPEKVSLELYDRELDKELLEEASLLMQTLSSEKAITQTVAEIHEEHEQKILKLSADIEKETDPKIKNRTAIELSALKGIQNSEQVKTLLNKNTIKNSVSESRSLIQKLKEEIKQQTKIKYVEAIPCMVSEAYLAFQQGKTIEGKETTDWVADLISKKVSNPKYSFEDAKKLLPNHKIAFKEALMKISDYKVKGYKDIMTEYTLMHDKPKTLKKDLPTEEPQTPTESAN